jgi:hypothetical protein
MAGDPMNNVNLMTLALDTSNRLLPELRQKNMQKNAFDKSYPTMLDTPSITQVLDRNQPVPFQTTLIGDCQDGLPFLMDLNQPENGPVLVTGDPETGKTRQLQVMVETALRLYTPRQVQVAVITRWPGDWEDILLGSSRRKFCHAITNLFDRKFMELVMDLTGLAEDRRNGRRRGAQVLLVIDELTGINDLDYEVQVNLRWLLEYGPQSGIWPLVSLEASKTQDMLYWVDVFRTRLLGHMDSITLANDLAIYPGNRCTQLIPSLEFIAWMGSDWITYHLPVLK